MHMFERFWQRHRECRITTLCYAKFRVRPKAGWHVLLLFFSNALLAFDDITALLDLHPQEPSPKRNLVEGPEAATQVDAGAHQHLICLNLSTGTFLSYISIAPKDIEPEYNRLYTTMDHSDMRGLVTT